MGNEYKAEEENNKDSDYNTDINSTTKIIYEISLSGIFALNRARYYRYREIVVYV